MADRSQPRHRAMWDDVLPRWRASQETLTELGADHATRSVHGAIMYLLAAHQRTEDRVYLGRIADLAGVREDRITARLRYLTDIGAIVYTPGRGRRAGTVALPIPALSAVASTRAERGNNAGGDPELPRSVGGTTALSGSNTRAQRGNTEDLSEDPSEGSSVTHEGEGARDDPAEALNGASTRPDYADRYREMIWRYVPTAGPTAEVDAVAAEATRIGERFWPQLFPPDGSNRHGVLDDIFDDIAHRRPRTLAHLEDRIATTIDQW